MDGPRSVGQSGVTVGDRSSGRSGGGGSHGSGGGSGGGGPCDGKSGRSLVVPAARSAWAWLYHRGYIKALFSTTTPTTTPSTITYFYSHMTNATPLSRLSPLSVRPLLLVSSSPMLSSSSSLLLLLFTSPLPPLFLSSYHPPSLSIATQRVSRSDPGGLHLL